MESFVDFYSIISHFSSSACLRSDGENELQQDSGEGRVTAKSRPMMNLTAKERLRSVSSSASANPGEVLVWISRS